MACSDHEFLKTEYYNDYLRKLGLFHSIGGTIAKRDDSGSFISTVRGRAGGPFGDPEVHIFGSEQEFVGRAGTQPFGEIGFHELNSEVA
jgi:hypothetical protein